MKWILIELELHDQSMQLLCFLGIGKSSRVQSEENGIGRNFKLNWVDYYQRQSLAILFCCGIGDSVVDMLPEPKPAPNSLFSVFSHIEREREREREKKKKKKTIKIVSFRHNLHDPLPMINRDRHEYQINQYLKL